MKYQVEFSREALKQLTKLDRQVTLLIVSWIRKNLQDCTDPYMLGKEITEHWKYRIGEYRLLCEIIEEKVIILVLSDRYRMK